MAKFHKKLIRVLREELGEVEDALEDMPDEWISGVIISPAFNRLDHRKRVKKLDRVLRKRLTPAELKKVGVIAALTPREAHVKAM
jgi:hypothetical protein